MTLIKCYPKLDMIYQTLLDKMKINTLKILELYKIVMGKYFKPFTIIKLNLMKIKYKFKYLFIKNDLN